MSENGTISIAAVLRSLRQERRPALRLVEGLDRLPRGPIPGQLRVPGLLQFHHRERPTLALPRTRGRFSIGPRMSAWFFSWPVIVTEGSDH